jgi:hypothetical protein
MACLSHPPRLDYSNYTWRRVQITKLLVMHIQNAYDLKSRNAGFPDKIFSCVPSVDPKIWCCFLILILKNFKNSNFVNYEIN